MAKFTKGILSAGRTYESPDGSLPVSRETLKHWRDTFATFKRKGLRVPMYWGHQDKVELSVPKRRLPDSCIGHLDDLRLSTDGNSLELTVDVPRESDADKVRHNLAELSPVVFKQWKDGDGTSYANCITGVDLVQHPVDHRQTGFQEVIACSIRMGLDTGNPQIYRLQSEDGEMPEDNENDDGEVDEVEVNGDGDRLKKVTEALAKMNIVLSDDTNEANFLEHLEQALLTVSAMANGNGGMDDMGGDLEQAPQGEFAGLSLDKRLERERKYLDKQHQKQIATRLSAVLANGQCTPAEYKQHEPGLKAVRLSLDEDGDPTPSPLETWVASREAVPKGTFWDPEKRTRLSALDLAPQPSDLNEGMELSDAEADKLADSILGRR